MLGKLVRVNQSVKEFTDVHGQMVGIVIEVHDESMPELLAVLWSDGDDGFETGECFYADELEFLN